jgi:uncharacterized protein (TIGR02217 family)
MAFRETPRFPERIAFGMQGGPAFSTNVITLSSGVESRNENWLQSRQEYDVSQGVKTMADFRLIRAFFRNMGGRRDGFRFKDWTDYTADFTEGGVRQLTSTTFQLVKEYSDGVNVDLRDIRKPIAAGFILRDVTTVLATPANYTLDATTGIITASGRTAANLNWSGQFDVPVRFDVDKLSATVVNRNEHDGYLISWEAIPLIETREDV